MPDPCPLTPTTAGRLAACLREGWRIVHDPLVRVEDLDHAERLLVAGLEAYNGDDWGDTADPLVAAVQALDGELTNIFLHITGDDCVW
jgi:hypothetical protein